MLPHLSAGVPGRARSPARLGRVCVSVPELGLGLPAPPAPVCAAELSTLSFFSDVIFKTSDMPVYEDIAGNTHGQVFVFYTRLWAYRAEPLPQRCHNFAKDF